MDNTGIDIEALVRNAGREFPALYQLFGGYFHQDWKLEYPDWQGAVSAFAQEAPAHLREDAVAEIARLGAGGLDDDQLGRMLYPGLQCNFIPSARDMTNAQWLQAIAEQIVSA